MFPNSQELSLSSAKTIADILTFAELLDSKSFIGNPFTSQPMYFAACAFLLESASHSSSRPSSRSASPIASPLRRTTFFPSISKAQEDFKNWETTISDRIPQPPNKPEHTKRGLLAAAASQNYQRCYKALKTLETYWAGARYIVTVLDQKARGSLDPLLYTAEYLGGVAEKTAANNALDAKDVRSRRGQTNRPGILEAGQQAHLARIKSAVTPDFEHRQRMSKSSEPSQGTLSICLCCV